MAWLAPKILAMFDVHRVGELLYTGIGTVLA